jgi:competence protein ComEC
VVAIGIAAIAGIFAGTRPASIGVGEQRLRGLIEARVSGIGRQSPGGWTLEVELERLDRRDVADRGQLRLFVPNEHLLAKEHVAKEHVAKEHVAKEHVARADQGKRRPPALPGAQIEVFARIERYPQKAFPTVASARTVMARRGIDARATAVEPITIVCDLRCDVHGDFIVFGDPLIWLEHQMAQGRAAFEGHLLEGLPDQNAALAVALTTGNRRFLTPATADPFRRTGTAHLLAISGLHLGVLAALLWWLFGAVVNRVPWLLRRWGRRRVCAAAVIAVLGCYVLAIGAPVSAVRAWVAIACGACALLLMRPLCPLHALAAAALGLMASEPAVVADLGFQLSFAATLGILLFLRYRPALLDTPEAPFAEPESPKRAWLRRVLLRPVGLFVGVSTSATLATWPVTAAHFGEVALAGLPVNLIVTPLVSALIFPVLVAGSMLSVVVELPGLWLVSVSTDALLAIGGLLGHVAERPGAQWTTGVAPWWAILALAIGALLAAVSRWKRRRLGCAVAAIALGLSVGLSDPVHEQEGELHVHFIPVGQGDATLVGFPDGTTMLVDGGGRRLGGDPGRFVVVPYLRRLGIDRLDWVVVTHADTDHLRGLFAVVESMRPRHFVFDADESDESLARLRRRAGRARVGHAGARLHPLSSDLRQTIGGVAVDMVRPQASSGGQNDASLVVRLSFGTAAVLLAGDVERGAERWLVEHEDVRATVLKVPHHGSKTSSSARFLDAVHPDMAVVSAGRFSRYGHPHAQVMARYKRRAIDVFQTAFDGLVRVEIDGQGLVEVHEVR